LASSKADNQFEYVLNASLTPYLVPLGAPVVITNPADAGVDELRPLDFNYFAYHFLIVSEMCLEIFHPALRNFTYVNKSLDAVIVFQLDESSVRSYAHDRGENYVSFFRDAFFLHFHPENWSGGFLIFTPRSR
jgi:hypothetical protein